MYWLKCSLLAAVLCGIAWNEAAAETQPPASTEGETPDTLIKKRNSSEGGLSMTPEEIFIYTTTTEDTQDMGNLTNVTVIEMQKRTVENATFNVIKPFLLFPFLPFLFPKENEKRRESPKEYNDSKTEGKPFIFLDMAFNIREIPLGNITGPANDSKITNVKKLTAEKAYDSTEKHSLKGKRRRRNARRHESGGFEDLPPIFPDPELDEFFPKPDLFFPDLSFSYKQPLNKLSRRKRDVKKTGMKNDFKLFMDAVDEAFMRTDPLLNLLRGEGEKKETDDFFNDLSDPKWGLQSSMKRSSDEQNPLGKSQETPMVIVDKVVNIGEFHVPDKGHDKIKGRKSKKRRKTKKRETIYSKWKFTGGNQDEKMSQPPNESEMVDETKGKSDLEHKNEMPTFIKVESQEIRIFPQVNASVLRVAENTTIELAKKSAVNSTQDSSGLLNVIDSIKPTVDRLKKKATSFYDRQKPLRDDLKKNITDVLNQFLSLARKLEDVESFDWTEKETLQNVGQNSRVRREQHEETFEDEYVDLEMINKERQIANSDYSFLTVTLPTFAVFGIILLFCFLSLKIRGKFCTHLFKPRQLVLVEDDNLPEFDSTGVKKTQAI